MSEDGKRGLSPSVAMIYLVIAVAIGFVVSEGAAWLFVRFYAYRSGADLHHLSEDYAMGFYGMLVQIGTFVAMSICMFLFLAKRSSK